MAALEYLKKIA